MKDYIRTAKYYETDQMGVIHHSNYIRWMEEARVDMLNQLGYPYRRFEEMGYISPVLHAECEYKKSVRFDDEVRITVTLKELGRVKFTLRYAIQIIKGIMAQVDMEKCVGCGKCAKECPAGVIMIQEADV